MAKGLSQIDQGSWDGNELVIDPAPVPDTDPDPFGWPSQSGWGTNQTATSNEIIPTGYNAAAQVSVDVGSFSVNGDTFSSTPRS